MKHERCEQKNSKTDLSRNLRLALGCCSLLSAFVGHPLQLLLSVCADCFLYNEDTPANAPQRP